MGKYTLIGYPLVVKYRDLCTEKRDWTDNTDHMLANRHILQLSASALLAVAIVMIPSAGMTVGTDGHGGGWLVGLTRDTVYALMAVVAMMVGCGLSVRRLRHLRGWGNPLPWLVVVSLGLSALALVPGMGRSVNGASRWLFLGPKSWGLSFQPSEMVKWMVVLALASWCARRRGVMHRFGYGLIPPLTLLGMACGLIVIEDLGTAALIGLVGGCVLLAGGGRWWQLALCAPLAISGLVAAMFHSPYRIKRLTMFLDPWVDPLGAGYHPIQSMLTIAQGGITGRGLGNGIQKFGYLPEDTTDFIFAIICEELGLAGALWVIGLYLVILWMGWSILRDSKDLFGRLFALGVLMTLGLQTLINLAVVTVLAPTKGIALPLLSKGGTGWILTAFCLGLVCGLDRENEANLDPIDADTPASPRGSRLSRQGRLESPNDQPVLLTTLDGA